MKLLPPVFVFIGVIFMVVGVAGNYFDSTLRLIPSLSFVGHIIFSNTFFLIALVLKMIKD